MFDNRKRRIFHSQEENPRHSWDVFISYSHKDSDLVLPFSKYLSKYLEEHNIFVYIDQKDQPQNDISGLNIGLSEGLSTCKIFLPCVTKNYHESEWCLEEFHAFLMRQLHKSAIFRNFNPQKGPSKSYPGQINSIGGGLDLSTGYLITLPVLIDSPDIRTSMQNLNWLMLKETAEHEKLFLKGLFFSSFFHLGNLNQYELSKNVASYIIEILKNSNEPKESFDSESLWKIFWDEYEKPEIGRTVDIYSLLNKLNSPFFVQKSLKKNIRQFSDTNLLILFEKIASQSGNMTCFNRWDAIRLPQSTQKGLKIYSHEGPPVAVLVGQVRNHPMLRPLQYSYYAYLENANRNKLVDAAIIAGLAMNINSWYERIDSAEDIQTMVIEPLLKGQDIASLFFY